MRRAAADAQPTPSARSRDSPRWPIIPCSLLARRRIVREGVRRNGGTRRPLSIHSARHALEHRRSIEPARRSDDVRGAGRRSCRRSMLGVAGMAILDRAAQTRSSPLGVPAVL